MPSHRRLGSPVPPVPHRRGQRCACKKTLFGGLGCPACSAPISPWGSSFACDLHAISRHALGTMGSCPTAPSPQLFPPRPLHGGTLGGWRRGREPPGEPPASVEGPEGEQGRLLGHEDEAEDGADVLGGHRLDGEVAQDLVAAKTLGQAKALGEAKTLAEARTLGQAKMLGQAKTPSGQAKRPLGQAKRSLGQAKTLS